MYRSLSLFVIIIVTCLVSCGKKENKELDLSPRIEYDKTEIVGKATGKDKEFFRRWSEGKLYEGFILDITEASTKDDVYNYAESRFKLFSKERRYKYAKDKIVYVLYCVDSYEVFVKVDKQVQAVLDGVRPGDFYRLLNKKYDNPTVVIKTLAQFKHDVYDEFEKKGVIKQIGIKNPILETLKLALDKMFIPSDGLLYQWFFILPFGAAMTSLKLFRSIYIAIVFFFLLFVMCNMASVRRVTRGKTTDITTGLFWGLSLLAFLSFCCLINCIEPSLEIKYGLVHYGYKDIFDSFFALRYAQYTKPATSTFTAIVIVILFVTDAFLSLGSKSEEERQNDYSNDDPFGSILVVLGGAITCQSYLGYIVLAYLLFRVIRTLYSWDAPDKSQVVSRSPIYYLGSLTMVPYLLIPIALDHISRWDAFKTVCSAIWCVMAISGVYLIITNFIKTKSIQDALVGFMNQTIPGKWRWDSFINYNLLFMAGISSPIYLLVSMLYAFFPGNDKYIDMFFFSIVLGVFFTYAIVLLFSFIASLPEARNNPSLLIKDAWESFIDKDADKGTTWEVFFNLTKARLKVASGWIGIFTFVPILVLFIMHFVK